MRMRKFRKKFISLIASVLCIMVLVQPVAAAAPVQDMQQTGVTAEVFENGGTENKMGVLADTSILSDEFREKFADAQMELIVPNQKTKMTYAMRSSDSMDVSLTVGERIGYNGFFTRDYKLSDGTTVFCLEPMENGPSSGNYRAYQSNDALLSAVMYYGYGGPGYYDTDLGMYYMFAEGARPYGYVLTHMALSYVYDGCSDDSDAFTGTNQSTVEGLKNIVAWLSNFTWSVPSNFSAFTVNTGSGTQAMGFGYTNPVGYLNLQKSSANLSVSDHNACYSLENAVYGVYYDAGCTNQAGTLTTDAAGKTNTIELDEGTYYVKELAAPEGFATSVEVKNVEVTSGNTSTVSVTDYPQSNPAGVLLGKTDEETSRNRPQGSASLAGAEFTVKYYDGYYVSDPALQGQRALRTWIFKTDSDGFTYYDPEYLISGDSLYYHNGTPTLPLGTITIQETKTPAGYLINSEMYVRQITSDSTAEFVHTYIQPNVPEQVIRGGVKINKCDYETKKTLPQGSASLAGAEFTIISLNDYAVVVEGVEYSKNQTVKTIVTNSSGYAATEADTLPFGKYKIKEIKAPFGYLNDGIVEREFFITRNEVIVDMTGMADSIQNQVIRGDFDMTKINSVTQQTMAGVTFKITSDTTGEFHYFTTDQNGYYSSSSDWNRHSYDTNGGTAESGLWFGMDSDGNQAAADDSLGALPYDTYTIEEIEGENNRGMRMYTGKLVIYKDSYTVHMNQIENDYLTDIGITTNAVDEDTGTKYALAQETTVIRDSVIISGLIPGKSYTLKGIAVDRETNRTISDNVIKLFTASSETVSKTMEYSFDSTGFEGHDIVVFEYLYMDGILMAAHEDLYDEEQTIHFPKISTMAIDNETKTHAAFADDKVTITDTVSYENVAGGRIYKVSGILMDRETGEPLKDKDGNSIETEKNFYTLKTSGKVSLQFTFDASAMEGKNVVVYEKFCTRSGLLIAVHQDLTDERQTIHFPEIHTEAAVNGEHTAEADEKMKLVDIVTYSNLFPGTEYMIRGRIIEKETGKEVLIDGKEVEANLTFEPETADGSVELIFEFDSRGLEGKDLVVFEELYMNEFPVSRHCNLNDAGQTIHIKDAEQMVHINDEVVQIPDVEKIKTDDVKKRIYVILLLVMAGVLLLGKRRKKS